MNIGNPPLKTKIINIKKTHLEIRVKQAKRSKGVELLDGLDEAELPEGGGLLVGRLNPDGWAGIERLHDGNT